MRRERDALILQVRETPDTLTQLRRTREVVERDREAVSIKLDAEYRAKVISGEIDDAETLVDIETESFLGREFPNWKNIGDSFDELKRARTPRLSITVLAANTDRCFTDDDFNKIVEPFINIITPSQIDELMTRLPMPKPVGKWGRDIQRCQIYRGFLCGNSIIKRISEYISYCYHILRMWNQAEMRDTHRCHIIQIPQ